MATTNSGHYEHTLQALREAGYRMTPQRAAIVEALHAANDHICADWLLERVQARHPYVDASTVYRTLDVLVGLGIVRTFVVAGEPVQYELADQPHHHLICTSCGSVAEFADYHLRDLAEHLREEHGFRADLSHLAITGCCAHCAPTPDDTTSAGE